jgi:predicted DNA-binding protein
MPRDLAVVSAKIPPRMVEKLDNLAGKLSCTRGEFIRYLIEAAISKPGLAEELLKLEEEKKQRLIRYIM